MKVTYLHSHLLWFSNRDSVGISEALSAGNAGFPANGNGKEGDGKEGDGKEAGTPQAPY
jgi:hypothetical protein